MVNSPNTTADHEENTLDYDEIMRILKDEQYLPYLSEQDGTKFTESSDTLLRFFEKQKGEDFDLDDKMNEMLQEVVRLRLKGKNAMQANRKVDRQMNADIADIAANVKMSVEQTEGLGKIQKELGERQGTVLGWIRTLLTTKDKKKEAGIKASEAMQINMLREGLKNPRQNRDDKGPDASMAV